VKRSKAKRRADRKRKMELKSRRIEYRLRERQGDDQPRPIFRGGNIRYEIAERDRGLAYGGIGLIHLMARELRLPERINERLKLLKRHMPYFESDHVLNIAYNALMDGSCLEDIELRRQDEVFLDALGAQRIPDPTTAGVRFIFGFDAIRPLVDRARALPETAWKRLTRPPKYERKTEPRTRPENVKARIVKEREFESIR